MIYLHVICSHFTHFARIFKKNSKESVIMLSTTKDLCWKKSNKRIISIFWTGINNEIPVTKIKFQFNNWKSHPISAVRNNLVILQELWKAVHFSTTYVFQLPWLRQLVEFLTTDYTKMCILQCWILNSKCLWLITIRNRKKLHQRNSFICWIMCYFR